MTGSVCGLCQWIPITESMRALAGHTEQMPAEDKGFLVIVPVPALVAVLKHAEDRKGSPLTESEVLDIRDGATCVRVPLEAAIEMAETRGYDDIAPETCREDWQEVRLLLQ